MVLQFDYNLEYMKIFRLQQMDEVFYPKNIELYYATHDPDDSIINCALHARYKFNARVLMVSNDGGLSTKIENLSQTNAIKVIDPTSFNGATDFINKNFKDFASKYI
jgi:hypothetical protein